MFKSCNQNNMMRLKIECVTIDPEAKRTKN